MKAPFIVRHNISALLAGRKESATSLARYVGNHKTWASQFLTGKRDELQLSDLDRIADFFGLATYQLFQPGISALTERRLTGDRRSGQDRRVGHQGRELAGLRSELNKLPAVASSRGTVSATHTSAASDPIQRVIERAAREIHALQSRGQAPTTGATRTRLPADRRKIRGSTAKQA